MGKRRVPTSSLAAAAAEKAEEEEEEEEAVAAKKTEKEAEEKKIEKETAKAKEVARRWWSVANKVGSVSWKERGEKAAIVGVPEKLHGAETEAAR